MICAYDMHTPSFMYHLIYFLIHTTSIINTYTQYIACSRTQKHLVKSQRAALGIDLARYIPLWRNKQYKQKVVVLGAGSFGTGKSTLVLIVFARCIY